MIRHLAIRGLFLAVGLFLSGLSRAAETTAPATNALPVIKPGPVDGQIASVSATMLENLHYLRQPFDEKVASRFFDRYFETLDPMHLHFTQADLAEFEPYRANLAHLTLAGKRRGEGDVTPACKIFNRYLQRVAQRAEYSEDLLQREKFTFTTDERITLNRKEMPYPADLEEARKLWRERVRFDYLQELLGKISARQKKPGAAAKKPAPAETNAPPPAPLPPPAAGTNGSPPHSAAPPSGRGSSPTRLASPKDKDSAAGARTDTDRPAVFAPVAVEGTRVKADSAAPAATGPAAPPKKSDDEEIIETLRHRYQRNRRFFADWNNDDVLQLYLTALARTYDPHSDYFGHAQLEQFSISMSLSLFGIGAELQSVDGYCKIRRLLPGGPAIKSKLIKVNDRIVAVAQGDQPPVDIVDMSLTKAVQLIRGPKGTEVRLTIIPDGAESATRNVVSLIRDEIPLTESAAKARIIEGPDANGQNLRLGVIDLPSFYATFDPQNTKDKPEPKSTTDDVIKLLDKLKQEKIAGLLLDLRNNGGGSLEEAIRLTGLFVKTNSVVQVRETDGQIQEAVDTDPLVAYDGPLVVLTSRHSASASEIVAGALQDYGRALIVGESSTHGKGTVQSVNQLRPYIRYPVPSLTNDPGALKLTIKTFFRPSGKSTQLRGVVPDIILPAVANESKDIGESALDNPLPWSTIRSARYDRFDLVKPYLPELRERSAARIAASKDYDYVREDIALFQKQQADKTLSLNLQQRLKEQQDAEARQKARERERRARPEPREKVYEITLQQAAQPGLPPPLAATNATTTAAADLDPDDPDDEAAESRAPAPDAPMLEAQQILRDYLSLLPKGNLLTARN